MKILIKAIQPHRQKVLTADGEEIRLQRWANKKAAESLRTAGGDAAGEQFTQARDKLMYDAVANPEEHGIKFMNERVPFEGQNLESSLSEPNVEGEQEDIHNEALADWEARQSDIDFSREQGHTDGFEGKPYHDMEQEELDADKKRFYENFPNLKPETPDLFDSEGKLRDGMPPEEEFNPDAEAEHMKRIMTSRQVPMRDAWSILKEMPQCKVCQGKLEEVHPGEGKMVCMNAKCPAQMMIQSEGQPPRLRFPAEMFPTGGFNSLEEMTENARNNPDYSQDLGY